MLAGVVVSAACLIGPGADTTAARNPDRNEPRGDDDGAAFETEQTLLLLEANDPADTVFVWRILNANTMQFVRQEARSGGRYLGATLSRDFDWETLVDNAPTPRVGRDSHPP